MAKAISGEKILVGSSWGLLLLGAGIVLLPLLVVLVTSFSTPNSVTGTQFTLAKPITNYPPLPITHYLFLCQLY